MLRRYVPASAQQGLRRFASTTAEAAADQTAAGSGAARKPRVPRKQRGKGYGSSYGPAVFTSLLVGSFAMFLSSTPKRPMPPDAPAQS
mmetsp:Transcript_12616/g.39254  ORF Transcript_12616/g.39254 Transcript_12616/m.39254 type:complete len:88 (+) Transcript_12616:38-301(+)